MIISERRIRDLIREMLTVKGVDRFDYTRRDYIRREIANMRANGATPEEIDEYIKYINTQILGPMTKSEFKDEHGTTFDAYKDVKAQFNRHAEVTRGYVLRMHDINLLKFWNPRDEVPCIIHRSLPLTGDDLPEIVVLLEGGTITHASEWDQMSTSVKTPSGLRTYPSGESSRLSNSPTWKEVEDYYNRKGLPERGFKPHVGEAFVVGARPAAIVVRPSKANSKYEAKYADETIKLIFDQDLPVVDENLNSLTPDRAKQALLTHSI